jgi:molecular chaperone DnaK (HSP70)
MSTVAMDFGTFNSAMAIRMPNGGVEFVRLPGCPDSVIPSFLLMRDGEVEQVGQDAKGAWPADPDHVLWGLKRLLGLSHHDAKERNQLQRFRYQVADHSGKLRIEVDGYVFSPVDLISSFLSRIREQAFQSPHAGVPFSAPETLILTHPAYFDTQQIASLASAAKRAGYKAVRFLREPEAAAMAHKKFIDFSAEPLVMVIDWGAGTLDFFIAHFLMGADGRPKVVENVPAYGVRELGGIDMDDVLARRFKELHGIGDLTDVEENQLKSWVEESKKALSKQESVTRVIGLSGRQYALRLCRTSPPAGAGGKWVCLEDMFADPAYGNVLGQFKEHLRFALKQNNLTTREIDCVILVGGPMCMPCARSAVAEVFADNNAVLKQLARIETEGFPVNPFEAVAMGAALSDEVDAGPVRLPYTYGFLMDGRLIENLLIPRGTLIARGGEKAAGYDGTIRPRAGRVFNVALYKAEEAPEGWRHSSLGHYDFAPVASPERGTAVTPSIRIDSDGICTLIVEDQNSGKPLTLPFKESPQIALVSAPTTMKLFNVKDIEEMRASDPEKYRLYTDEWDSGTFTAQEVDRQRQKAVILKKSLQQAVNQGRSLPVGAEQLFRRLGEAIAQVQPGTDVEADSVGAAAFQEMINAYSELAQNLRNDSFEW